MKTIDVNALEWFDKANGNSYFAAEIVLDYGTPQTKRIVLPFQYGYGDHFTDKAFDALVKSGDVEDAENMERLWRYCERKGIVLRTTKQHNCKKRELKAIA